MTTIGKYKEIYRNADESLLDHISAQPHPQKAELLKYMRSFQPEAAMPMIAIDAVDGKTTIGTVGEYTDGAFSWRSPLVYYFDKYNVALPDEFVAHALKH